MIQQRGRRWRVVVRARPDPLTGKRRQLSGSTATRREAVQLERRLRLQASEVVDGRITVRQLFDEWHESEPDSPLSVECHHVLRLLGDKRVEQIRPRLVARFLEYLRDDGMSAAGLAGVRRSLSALTSFAVAMEYAPSNPVTYVPLPADAQSD